MTKLLEIILKLKGIFMQSDVLRFLFDSHFRSFWQWFAFQIFIFVLRLFRLRSSLKRRNLDNNKIRYQSYKWPSEVETDFPFESLCVVVDDLVPEFVCLFACLIAFVPNELLHSRVFMFCCGC